MTAPLGPWMQTRHGRGFPLVNPSPADVHWDDVIWHLAVCNRFAGAVQYQRGFYSVAQHSLVVEDLMPRELRSYGLLHDSEEFAINDITTPTKQALIVCGMPAGALKALKDGIRSAIYRRAGLAWPVPAEIEKLVKHADLVAMATEKRDLLVSVPGVTEEEWMHGYEVVEPMHERITAWPAERAAARFAEALHRHGIN